MTFCVIIPARFDSTRLPGKPLLDIGGRPMIEHVYRRAMGSGGAPVVVATDDERIRATVEGFGGHVCMTGGQHRSGSERLAEAAAALGLSDETVVVNLQGDEPLMPSALIRQVAEGLASNPEADVATLCTPVRTAAELFDPHAVKVVLDRRGFALYFSRAPVPWDRDAFSATMETLPEEAEHYRHIGLYAYRVGFLRRYEAMAPCRLEAVESLEQLRVLWHGGRIHVSQAVEAPPAGVDTPGDLEVVRRRFAEEPC